MKTLSNMGFAVFGAALVAISYGMARFAFGLFVPSISAELALTPYLIGIIGALPFISFVLATLAAPLAAHRFGARNLAVLSGGFGVGGLALISQASDALSLGAGVFICGICTGLMMPALTAAMQALVSRTMHGRVSSIMNAGTSVGIIVAVPTVVFLSDAWRLTYTIFAALPSVWWRHGTSFLQCHGWFQPTLLRLLPLPACSGRGSFGFRCLLSRWGLCLLRTGFSHLIWRSLLARYPLAKPAGYGLRSVLPGWGVPW